MKKCYIILLFFFLLSYLDASAQAWEWAKQVHNATSLRTVSDGSGNIYLAGSFRELCVIPGAIITAADSAVFIAKYTGSGQLLWQRKMEAKQIELKALQFHNEEVYLGGWFTGQLNVGQQFASAGRADIFIARISSEGIYTFIKTDGGQNDEMLFTMSVYDTYILCGGWYYGTALLGGNPLTSIAPGERGNTFFARYALSGSVMWAKAIRSKENYQYGELQFVKADPSGNIYVLGNFYGAMDYGGVDSSFYYCGVLVKYDPNGNFLEFLMCAGGYAQWIQGFEFDGEGNFYILKSVSGNHNHPGNCLSKYFPSGKGVWSRTVGGGWSYGTEGMCSPGSMVLRNGALFITGSYWGHITLPGNGLLSGDGIYVFKYDLNGNLLMVRNSNGGGGYAPSGFIDADNDGNVYITCSNAAGGDAFGDVVLGEGGDQGFPVFAKLSNSMTESRPSIMLDPAVYSDGAGKGVWLKTKAQNVAFIRWYLPGGYPLYGSDGPLFTFEPWWQYDTAGFILLM